MSARPQLTQSEKAYIHTNYSTHTTKEVGLILNRQAQTIYAYCKRQGLKFKRGKKAKMTTEEKQDIADNYKTMTHAAIADVVGKSEGGISRYCKENKLIKRCKSVEFIEEQHKIKSRKQREGKPYTRPDKITTPHQALIHQEIKKWNPISSFA